MSTSTIEHLDLARLPVNQKEMLTKILDLNDSFEELGKLMKFSEFDIETIKSDAARQGRSPSDVLITRWSSRYGHNVTELFKLLSDMQHFQAMEVIKDLVDKRYHVWFKPVQPHISRLMMEQSYKKNVMGQSQIFAQKNPLKGDDCAKDELQERLKELLNIPEVPIEQLAEATNKWSEQNVLGKGGFGVVYKGDWLSTKVAIKKLEYRASRSGSSKDYLMQSLNELRHLNHCRHDNILPIYGYAMRDDLCFVVYQLMPGGSLEERLLKKNGSEPLTWLQRWNIAKGTARGLQYLHRYAVKPLIHSDIKPANILLDTCGEPKIGDFGLSREGNLLDEFHEVSRVFGTRPYLPKEFIEKSLFSTKVDVFSFGVVLFELATSLKAHDKLRKHNFLYDHMARIDENSYENIASIIDTSTPNDQACFNLCQLMVYLGKKCTDVNPNYRPEMNGVLKALEGFIPVITAN